MAQVKIKSRTVIGIMKIINVFWGFEQTQKPKRIEKLKKNILKKATKNIQTVNFLILSDREDASRREWSVFCRQSWRKRRSRIWISQRTQTSTLTLVSLARKIASAKIRFGFSFLRWCYTGQFSTTFLMQISLHKRLTRIDLLCKLICITIYKSSLKLSCVTSPSANQNLPLKNPELRACSYELGWPGKPGSPRSCYFTLEKTLCSYEKRASPARCMRSHLELDGIPVKWDENFPYEHNFAGQARSTGLN